MKASATVLGERVRGARRRVGLTQQELADRVGCSMMSICYIETGRTHSPNFEIMTELARALNVSLNYFAGLIDEPRPLPHQKVVMDIPYMLSRARVDQW